MATFAQIKTTVRYRLGNRDDLTSGEGLVALTEWINEAYREIANTIAFHELESPDNSLVTNATDRFVILPTNVYAILAVKDVTNDRVLDPFPGSFAEYERQVRETGGRSRPTQYLHHAGRMYFKDPPDGAYTLRSSYWIEPTSLAADGESPILREIWHDGIKILATRNGWRGLGDDTRAERIERGEWLSFIARVRTPMGIERYNSKRRGTRVRGYARNPITGV